MLEQGRCETCKWWDKLTVAERDRVPAPSQYYPLRVCMLLDGSARSDESPPEDFSTMTYGQWGPGGVGIVTGAKFGCIHWESPDEYSESPE